MLDRFVQWQLGADPWLPCKSCPGNASILSEHLPFLRRNVLKRYLVQKPSWQEVGDAEDRSSAWLKLRDGRDVKAKPSDEFTVFDECAVLDFLRYLGVRVVLRDHCVKLQAPVWNRFWIERG